MKRSSKNIAVKIHQKRIAVKFQITTDTSYPIFGGPKSPNHYIRKTKSEIKPYLYGGMYISVKLCILCAIV